MSFNFPNCCNHPPLLCRLRLFFQCSYTLPISAYFLYCHCGRKQLLATELYIAVFYLLSIVSAAIKSRRFLRIYDKSTSWKICISAFVVGTVLASQQRLEEVGYQVVLTYILNEDTKTTTPYLDTSGVQMLGRKEQSALWFWRLRQSVEVDD